MSIMISDLPSIEELLNVVRIPLACCILSTGLVDNSSTDSWISVKADSWLLLPINKN